MGKPSPWVHIVVLALASASAYPGGDNQGINEWIVDTMHCWLSHYSIITYMFSKKYYLYAAFNQKFSEIQSSAWTPLAWGWQKRLWKVIRWGMCKQELGDNPISFAERCSGRSHRPKSHHPKWHPPPHLPHPECTPAPPLTASLAPAVAQIPGDGSSLIEISPSAV